MVYLNIGFSPIDGKAATSLDRGKQENSAPSDEGAVNFVD